MLAHGEHGSTTIRAAALMEIRSVRVQPAFRLQKIVTTVRLLFIGLLENFTQNHQ